ncbi:phage tail tape measure protein [Microaceticoccus formicicus]|uniref:phage tail tape measure protein n=1 Tax=Microaceticoccus formicicus TaxID=3118105 RepID=UPI003CD0267D|nr:phage tail tape measure protein [Peptoniphilaceae bacterium AMB_02]
MSGPIKGITIELAGDTSKLEKAIRSVGKDANKLDGELRKVNNSLKFNPGNADLVAQKQRILKDAIQETSKKLETLKTAQQEAKAAFERGEIGREQYDLLTREVVKTENQLSKLKSTLEEISSKWKASGEKIQEVGKKMESTGTKMSKGITAPIMGIAAASMVAFNEVDAGMDTIISKTGATGDAAAELEQSYKNLAGNIPASFDEVGNAIGEVNTQFGFMGEELERASEKVIKFAQINEADVTNSTIKAKQAIEKYGLEAKDLDMVLDSVTKTAQNTGVSTDRLFDIAIKGSPQIAELGLNFSQATEMLGRMEQKGIDGTKALSYLTRAQTQWAKEGKSMTDGLAELEERLAGATTQEEKLAIAAEVFGTKGGAFMLEAFEQGALSAQEFANAQEEAAGAVESTWQGMLDPVDLTKQAMNNLKITGADLATSLQGVLLPMIESVIGGLKKFADWFGKLSPKTKETIVKVGLFAAALGPVIIMIGKVVGAIGTIVSGIGVLSGAIAAAGGIGAAASAAFGAAMTFITGPIGIAIAAVTALIGVGVLLYKNWDKIKEVANNVWNGLKEFFSNLWSGISESWSAAWEGITAFISETWNAFGEFAVGVWNGIIESITTVWQTITDFFSGLWEGVQTIFTTIWDAIVSFVVGKFTETYNQAQTTFELIKTVIETVWNTIKTVTETIWNGIKSFVETIWTGIKSFVDTTINAVKSTIDTVLNGIKSIFDTIWNAIKSVVESVLNGIKGTIDSVMNGAKNIVDSTLNTIKGIFDSVWNAIKSLIDNILGNIKNTVESGMNSAKSTIESISNAIKGVFESVWSTFKNAVTDAFNNVKSAVSNGMQAAFDTVTGWISSFYNAGSNIIGSIADGIRNAVGKVTGAISSVVAAVRRFLPFSPAKEGPLKDIHRLNFGGPISDSIKNSEREVTDAMGDLAGATLDTLKKGIEDKGNLAERAMEDVIKNITSNEDKYRALLEKFDLIDDGAFDKFKAGGIEAFEELASLAQTFVESEGASVVDLAEVFGESWTEELYNVMYTYSEWDMVAQKTNIDLERMNQEYAKSYRKVSGEIVEQNRKVAYSVTTSMETMREESKKNVHSMRTELKDLGFDHDSMINKFESGGHVANLAIAQITRELVNMDDQVKANEIGIGLFGDTWTAELGKMINNFGEFYGEQEQFWTFNENKAIEHMNRVATAAMSVEDVVRDSTLDSTEKVQVVMAQREEHVKTSLENMKAYVESHKEEFINAMVAMGGHGEDEWNNIVHGGEGAYGVIAKVIEQLSNITDQTTRAEIKTKAFGDSWNHEAIVMIKTLGQWQEEYNVGSWSLDQSKLMGASLAEVTAAAEKMKESLKMEDAAKSTKDEAMKQMKESVNKELEEIQSLTKKILGTVYAEFETVFKKINDTVIKSFNDNIIPSLAEQLKLGFKETDKFLRDVFDGFKHVFHELTDIVSNAFRNGIIPKLAQQIGIALQALDSANQSMYNIGLSWMRSLANGIQAGLGGVVGQLNTIPNVQLQGATGNINWYDRGGIFRSPTIIGVGERRPEFVGALDDLKKIVADVMVENKSNSESKIIIQNMTVRNDSDIRRIAEELDKLRRRGERSRG